MEQYQWRTYSNIWHVYNYLYVLAFCYYYHDCNYNYFIFLLYVRRPSGESCLTLTTSSKKKKKEKNEVEQKILPSKKNYLWKYKTDIFNSVSLWSTTWTKYLFLRNLNQFLPSQNQGVQVHVFKWKAISNLLCSFKFLIVANTKWNKKINKIQSFIYFLVQSGLNSE